MPKKKITADVTLGVDSGYRDAAGAPITTMVPPGTEVVLEASEADRIIARWGGEVLEEIPDETVAK